MNRRGFIASLAVAPLLRWGPGITAPETHHVSETLSFWVADGIDDYEVTIPAGDWTTEELVDLVRRQTDNMFEVTCKGERLVVMPKAKRWRR